VETDGEIPEDLRAGVGEHLFGCDDCQNACPYNAAAPAETRPQYGTLERWRAVSLETLVDLGAEAYGELVRGSPVRRMACRGLARNAITVLCNRRLPRYRAFLERVASSHPDEAVRRHALWGLGQLGGSKGAAK
jgi:epoxyqueuosine reductase